MAEIVFRLPGAEMYSYAEVSISEEDYQLWESNNDSKVSEYLRNVVADLNAAYPGANPTQSSRPSAVTAAAPASSSGRACDHGAMTLREGKSAKGNWAAYFCPEKDRANQCKPVDAVTGKPWGK